MPSSSDWKQLGVAPASNAFSLLARRPSIGSPAPVHINKQHLVWGDRLRLRQCLSNLLSNAIKFSNYGGKITVTFSFDSSTAYCPINTRKRTNSIDEITKTPKFDKQAEKWSTSLPIVSTRINVQDQGCGKQIQTQLKKHKQIHLVDHACYCWFA
jgi:signal transduction histidine kinase